MHSNTEESSTNNTANDSTNTHEDELVRSSVDNEEQISITVENELFPNEEKMEDKESSFIVNDNDLYEKHILNNEKASMIVHNLDENNILSTSNQQNSTIIQDESVNSDNVDMQMEMNEGTWGLVNRAFNMAKFLGANNKPAKVSEEEVQRIISKINDVVPIAEEAERFELQDIVLIMDGPFQNFEGVIKEMNREKFKLTVSVNILGRDADVNLDFDQVRKKDI
jgi:transcriptional antiterminator NusG